MNVKIFSFFRFKDKKSVGGSYFLMDLHDERNAHQPSGELINIFDVYL